MSTTGSAPADLLRVPQRPLLRRRPPRPRPVLVDVAAALAGLGLGATLALGITSESASSISTLPGLLTAAGRLAGLLAAYGMMIVVALSARIPPLERAVGQDRLLLWHRRLGPWTLYALAAHGVLVVLGYAGSARTGVLAELWDLITTYPGLLAATVGGTLLVLAGVTSYRRARRRLRYETWWAIHLYTYLGLLFAFSHQVDDGASFVGHPVERAWWTALWVLLLAAVVAFRIGLPVLRSLRHGVRVAEVVQEGRNVWSVLLDGRDLAALPVTGGQFFQWRFLQPGLWWQAHPYSLSAVPHEDRMRITVKDLGDHSAGLATLQPGTRVLIEGPYGVFTADAATGRGVVLLGAGVGVTPLAALLQDLDEHADVVVVLRASTREDLVLLGPVTAEVTRRGGRLYEAVGPRTAVAVTAASLRRAVPDIASRDVFVCGPEGFTAGAVAAAADAGVPASRIHSESFAF